MPGFTRYLSICAQRPAALSGASFEGIGRWCKQRGAAVPSRSEPLLFLLAVTPGIVTTSRYRRTACAGGRAGASPASEDWVSHAVPPGAHRLHEAKGVWEEREERGWLLRRVNTS